MSVTLTGPSSLRRRVSSSQMGTSYSFFFVARCGCSSVPDACCGPIVASVRKTMRSSVPCSSWIDSFSLLDIQVVSLKREYYVSLACQVDSREITPSRKTAQVLAVRDLRNHTTIEISLSLIHMVSGLVLEPI